MTDTPSKTTTRRPDCVTEIRMGNTVLTVSGYFKQDTTDTAADKRFGLKCINKNRLKSRDNSVIVDTNNYK